VRGSSLAVVMSGADDELRAQLTGRDLDVLYRALETLHTYVAAGDHVAEPERRRADVAGTR
jgi:hypothetical protein